MIARRVLSFALVPALACAVLQDEVDPPSLVAGDVAFEWVEGWGRLPEGVAWANTHGGIVVDAAGRIYVNTDGEHAVMVFDAAGDLVDSFGAELAGGLHGMAIVAGADGEELWLAHTGRHEVVRTDLAGKVLATLPFPGGDELYEDPNAYRPTAVAVAPDGRVFVADGYGMSYVHVYDADGAYVRSIGGAGRAPGFFRTPHGLWIDERDDATELIVADRENHRLQRFDLDGNLVGIVEAELRRPCGMHRHGDLLAVADLTGRITLLGKDFELLGHLGEQPDPARRAQNGVPPADWRAGEFISPHAVRFDAAGNLYVMDWVSAGRVTKLSRR